jgi:hypothetical protein
MKGIIISLCDLTGVMVQPWLAAGYHAVQIDPQHPAGVTVDDQVTKVGHVIDHPVSWQVLRETIATGRVVFVAGFPPCTDLAVSGARWFQSKAAADPAFQFKAMQVVHQCQVIGELSGAPWFAENPVSRISSFWRRPNHSFDPHQFTELAANDNYTKKTCLWTGGGFVMPKPCPDVTLGLPDDRIHKCPPGAERGNIRSATPAGFAIAVFLANAPHLNRANDNAERAEQCANG